MKGIFVFKKLFFFWGMGYGNWGEGELGNRKKEGKLKISFFCRDN